MHAHQVIKGKKLFTIIETQFGISRPAGLAPYLVEELSHYTSKNALMHNPQAVALATIHTSDAEIKRICNASKLA